MMILFVLFTVGLSCLADSPVIADVKEFFKLSRKDIEVVELHDGKLPQPDTNNEYIKAHNERRAQMAILRERIDPIVNRELDKLVEGEATPLMRDLLNDSETADFCLHYLITRQLLTCSAETRTFVINTVFPIVPNSSRKKLVVFPLCLTKRLFPNFPEKMDSFFTKETFSGKEVQEWLVEKINSGVPAGPTYFILTDENAEVVMEAAKAGMKRFSKTNDSRAYSDDNLFSLISASFLASRGDEDAIKLLELLLEQRDIEFLLDTCYVIQAAAMSGNKSLIQKIRDIITTDTRFRDSGHKSEPFTFAQTAAHACSVMMEGFPSVGYWDDYGEDKQKKVHDWLKNNPTHTIKPDSALVFFQLLESPFESITLTMLRMGWGE